MKTTRLVNKLDIGTKIKFKYLSLEKTEICYVIPNNSGTMSTRLLLSNVMWMDKDLTIQGRDRTIATCKVIPYKRFKFRYKR